MAAKKKSMSQDTWHKLLPSGILILGLLLWDSIIYFYNLNSVHYLINFVVLFGILMIWSSKISK